MIKKNHGPEHPEVAIDLNNLATVLFKLDKKSKAQELLLEALKIQRRCLNPHHPDIATTLDNLGQYYLEIGNMQKGVECLEERIQILIYNDGPNQPQVGLAYSNLGLHYGSMKQPQKQIECYEKVVEIDRALGSEDLAVDLNNLGFAYGDIDVKKAEECHTEAEELCDKNSNKLGQAISYNGLGQVAEKQGDYSAAANYYYLANISVRFYDPDHPLVELALQNKSRVERLLK